MDSHIILGACLLFIIVDLLASRMERRGGIGVKPPPTGQRPPPPPPQPPSKLK